MLNNKPFVIKQIHHEPCSYYQFGNKIEAESNDYKRLLETGIRIPKLIEIDYQNEIVVKEYIEGPTIEELKKENRKLKTKMVEYDMYVKESKYRLLSD